MCAAGTVGPFAQELVQNPDVTVIEIADDTDDLDLTIAGDLADWLIEVYSD